MKKLLLLTILCLSQGAFGMKKEDIDQELIIAANKGNYDLVIDLLKRGANVNAQNKRYGTPLLGAIATGRAQTVRLLLERGADANLADEVRTPLMAAQSFGCHLESKLEVTFLLLKYGADVNARDFNGVTALAEAFDKRLIANAKLLLRHGAQINLRDAVAKMFLINSAQAGDLELVHYLLKHNADPKIQGGEYNASALMWAANNGFYEIALALLTTISDDRAQEIKKSFEGLLAIQRKRLVPQRGGWEVAQSEESVTAGMPDELKQVRKLIAQHIVGEYVNEYMQRAVFLMKQVNEDNRTAHDIAVIQNHPEIAKLIDPNNVISQGDIRSKIESNIKRILFGEHKHRERTREISEEEAFGSF